jgi:hypothetical protein
VTSDKWLVLAAGVYLCFIVALAASMGAPLLVAAVVVGGAIAGVEHAVRR